MAHLHPLGPPVTLSEKEVGDFQSVVISSVCGFAKEFYDLIQHHPAQVSGRRATVRKRFDGCGMGANRAAVAASIAAWPSARDGPAIGDERDLVHRLDRLPVAGIAERLPAVFDPCRVISTPGRAAAFS